MPKIIHFDRCEIVNGEIVRTSHDEVYPDDKVRHCDWCTVCQWDDYPACLKYCENIDEDDRQAGLELL